MAIGLIVAVPIGVGLVVSIFCTFGRDADVEVYKTIAEIAPVLTLAAVIETLPGVFRGIRDRSAIRLLGRTTVGAQAAWLLLVESLALYAIAAQETTTFLLVTCLVTLLLQVVSLANLAFRLLTREREN